MNTIRAEGILFSDYWKVSCVVAEFKGNGERSMAKNHHLLFSEILEKL